jgi:serine-type D-Ala-D-Ala carboxypeptidase (penicillin-binding protein 5/6)
MRRSLLWAALACLAYSGGAATATDVATTPVTDRFPEIASAYAVVIDDELSWARALDSPRQPASLAKLLSGLVLLERDWDPERLIVVSASAAAIEGSRVGLRAGEQIRAADALTAMLVRSANDACLALVEQRSGNSPAFAIEMNRMAQRLGMKASRFVQPCGLDAPGQYSTVRDLLLLAHAAAGSPQIALRAGAQKATLTTAQGRRLEFHNSNALIGRDARARGLKSGYTSQAGRCLIALAEADGHRVMVVMLDAPDRWWGVTGVLDVAFRTARYRTLLKTHGQQ